MSCLWWGCHAAFLHSFVFLAAWESSRVKWPRDITHFSFAKAITHGDMHSWSLWGSELASLQKPGPAQTFSRRFYFLRSVCGSQFRLTEAWTAWFGYTFAFLLSGVESAIFWGCSGVCVENSGRSWQGLQPSQYPVSQDCFSSSDLIGPSFPSPGGYQGCGDGHRPLGLQ